MIYKRDGLNGPRYEVRAKRPNSRKLIYISSHDNIQDAQAALDEVTQQFLKEWLKTVKTGKPYMKKGATKYQALYKWLVMKYGVCLHETTYTDLAEQYTKAGGKLTAASLASYFAILRQKQFLSTAKINGRLFVKIFTCYNG